MSPLHAELESNVACLDVSSVSWQQRLL